MKTLPKHFTATYHVGNMRKDNLLTVNGEILAKLSDNEDNLPITLPQSKPITALEAKQEDFSFKTEERMEDIKLKFIITQFILFNRLPFSIAPGLVEFIQDLVTTYNKNTLMKCNLNRNIVTDLTHKCISSSLKDQIFDELKISPFSLLIDGGSDFYGTSYLTVCVKYIGRDSKQPITKLLSLIELGEKSTGEALFNEIQKTILYENQIQNNFMALATDQGSNMSGNTIGLGK